MKQVITPALHSDLPGRSHWNWEQCVWALGGGLEVVPQGDPGVVLWEGLWEDLGEALPFRH